MTTNNSPIKNIGREGMFWSSTPHFDNSSKAYHLWFIHTDLSSSSYTSHVEGFSVR